MQYSLRDGKGTRANSIKEIKLESGVIIGIFQGSKGNNPELDIIVKYQQPGGKVRTPQHLHWAIDLIIKKEHKKELTKEFIKYLQEMWNKVTPFANKYEQQECELKYSSKSELGKFMELNKFGEYSVEFIACVLELLMIQEKTGLATAFMFKGVLDALYHDKDIFTIVSSAGYKGR